MSKTMYRMRCPECEREAFTKLPPLIRGKLTCGHCAASKFRVELVQVDGSAALPVADLAMVEGAKLRCDNCGKPAGKGQEPEKTHWKVRKDKMGRALSANACGTFRLLLAAFALALVLAGPARADWPAPLTGPQIAGHVAAESVLLIDALQSLDIKNHPEVFEVNPLLGRHPSDGAYLGAAGLAVLVSTAVWYAAPSDVRPFLDGALLGWELHVVIRNAALGLSVRVPW